VVTELGGEADNGRPASRRVADELRSAIEAGDYPPGAVLPPLRQLAADHQVAVNTAMVAVRLLVEDGYVVSKPNAGNYVRDRSNQVDPLDQLRAIRADLGELQSKVRQLGADVDAVGSKLAGLSESIARLEDEHRPR
jgi:DNA-binding GntR family transcriptional regulator